MLLVLCSLALAADPAASVPLTFDAVPIVAVTPKPSIEILPTRIDVSRSVDVQIQAEVTKRLDALVEERQQPKP